MIRGLLGKKPVVPNDLIYEGITTSHNCPNTIPSSSVPNDLIYEGITTKAGLRFLFPPHVPNDLIYEGITTGFPYRRSL